MTLFCSACTTPSSHAQCLDEVIGNTSKNSSQTQWTDSATEYTNLSTRKCELLLSSQPSNMPMPSKTPENPEEAKQSLFQLATAWGGKFSSICFLSFLLSNLSTEYRKLITSHQRTPFLPRSQQPSYSPNTPVPSRPSQCSSRPSSSSLPISMSRASRKIPRV